MLGLDMITVDCFNMMYFFINGKNKLLLQNLLLPLTKINHGGFPQIEAINNQSFILINQFSELL